MVQRADVIRHDIADTRAAMTVKLALLEERLLATVTGTQASVEKIMDEVRGTVTEVRGTVQDVGAIVTEVKASVDTTLVALRQGTASTQAAVEEIVAHAKGAVAESIATVKHTFDVPGQVQRHPWPMLGGALLVGYLCGRRGGRRTSAADSPQGAPDAAPGVLAQGAVQAARPVSPAAAPVAGARPQPGIVSGVLEQLKHEMRHEITNLTSDAVRAAVTLLHEMFKPAVASAPAPAEHTPTQPGSRPDGSEPQPVSGSGVALNGVPSQVSRGKAVG